MKRFWWMPVLGALTSCNSSSGGRESHVVPCKSANDCASGFVCGAGTCERPDATASSAGAGGSAGGAGRSSTPPESGGAPAAGGTGGAVHNEGGTGRDASVHSDASSKGGLDAGDASQDGHSRARDGVGSDASVAQPCFDVVPGRCGAIVQWSPLDPTGRWTVQHATPIEGADGFVALLSHGAFGTADSYEFVTLGADGGCAKPASPSWSEVTKFAAPYRAVSRGGTLAVVGQCVQRFLCGATLFLNGKEWIDPIGHAYYVYVDVASDGRVLLATNDYVSGDAATSQELVERWLSPEGQILLERRYPNVVPYAVAILDDGTVALAAAPASTTAAGASYVQFQSATFDDISTWSPGADRLVLTMAHRWPLLAVAGSSGSSLNVWTGVLNAQTRQEVWMRARNDLTGGEPLAVAIDAAGSVSAAVLEPFGRASYLLLHDTKTTPGSLTAQFDPAIAPGPGGIPLFGGMAARANGEILFSTDFPGTYCEGD